MKSPRQNSVVVVGSSNTDLVLNTPHLPRPGETVLGGQFHRFAGGKGANQAIAAARAGAKVAFIGARGDDDFGRAAYSSLRAEGIDVRHFKVKQDHPSGVALIFVGGRASENMIGVARSANDALTPDDVHAAQVLLKRAKVVVAQLEVPLEAVRVAAELAHDFGAIFLLNPAPARKLPAALLRRVGVLTPNATEAELLTGESEPEAAAKVLLSRGCQRVALTLGARGVLLADKNGVRMIKAPRVRPVDTVGAGDCFSGCLAAGLAQELGFDEAAQKAVTAASISVTRPGAQSGMPFQQEVEAIESNRGSG